MYMYIYIHIYVYTYMCVCVCVCVCVCAGVVWRRECVILCTHTLRGWLRWVYCLVWNDGPVVEKEDIG